MNREEYFNYIERKLSELQVSVERRASLNLLDINIHAEDFFARILNELYGYNLINLNGIDKNSAAIDLIDEGRFVCFQISSSSSNKKIQDTLDKFNSEKYQNYNLKFLFISNKRPSCNNVHNIPSRLIFNKEKDVYDLTKLLSEINHTTTEKLKNIYEYTKKEFEDEFINTRFISPETVFYDTNLAEVVNVLSREISAEFNNNIDVTPFEIQRKIDSNDLSNLNDIFRNYSIYNTRLENIYSEYDKNGKNVGLSILNYLQELYLRYRSKCDNSEDLLFFIIDEVRRKIYNSRNYHKLPYEELTLYVYIIVVDAFIRCKIFKKP